MSDGCCGLRAGNPVLSGIEVMGDAEGNFTKPMDFSKLDEYMELLPETRLYSLIAHQRESQNMNY